MDRRIRWPILLGGALTLAAAVALWLNLGASPSRVRLLLSGLWLALAAWAGWRWWLSRLPALLVEALVSLVAGVILLFGAALPVATHKWIVGAGWLAVGVIELVERSRAPRPALLSFWTAVWTLFAGVVTITFPGILAVQLTALASIAAGLFGLMLLWRGWRLGSNPPPPSRVGRVTRVAIPGALLILAVWGYSQVVANTAAADARQRVLASFYAVPPDLAPGEPGELIRFEHAAVPGLEGRAYRILFRSDDAFSRPTVSSGMVFLPKEDTDDRPVIAWAHGTVGLGEECAPSRAADVLAQTQWVNAALEAGYVVAAPDYAGAGGTGSGEKYMVLAEQGRDVVHSVRAAISLPGSGAAGRYATYGESQGGAVALAAGAMSAELAPDLELMGVGAVAAASDLATTLSEKWESPLATWLLGPHLLRAYTRYYPHLTADRILTEAGRNHYAEIADSSCVHDLLGVLLNPRIGAFLTGDPTDDPAWLEALVANRAPDVLDGVPVFAAHGLDDPLIDSRITAALVSRYCEAATEVTAHWMEGVGHIGSSNEAAPAYLAWLAELDSGGSPGSACGDPLPGEPTG